MRTLKYSLIAVGLSVSAPAGAASFNCDYAKLPTEVLICKDDELTIQDEVNAKIFSSIRNALDAQRRKDFNKWNKAWLKKRNACGFDHRCVSDRYDEALTLMWNILPAKEALALCSTEDGSFIAPCARINEADAALEVEGDREEALAHEKYKLYKLFQRVGDIPGLGKYVLGLQAEWEARENRTFEEYATMTKVLCTAAKEQKVDIADCDM